MSKDSKAFENFNAAHATGDKPAPQAATEARSDQQRDDASKPAAGTTEKPGSANQAESPDDASKAERGATESAPTEDKPKHRSSPSDADHDLNWAYQQGIMARKNAISKDDAPHDSESHEFKAWRQGWNHEDKL